MTSRFATRLACAASVLALALTATGGQALAGDLSGALTYVPADFTTVVAIDVEQMSKSPIYKMLRDEVLRGADTKEIKRFEKETGFDVLEDIKAVVIAGPDAMLSGRGDNFLVILQGAFDEQRIVAFAKKEGAPITEQKGPNGTWWNIDGQGALAFRDGFIIVAPQAHFEAALAAKKAKKDITTGPLRALIGSFKGSKSGFAVSSSDALIKDLKRDQPQLSDFEGAGVGFDVSKGLALRVAANFKNDATAADLAKLLNELIAQAKEEPDLKEAGLADMIKTVKAETKGKTINVDMSLTEAQVRELVSMTR